MRAHNPPFLHQRSQPGPDRTTSPSPPATSSSNRAHCLNILSPRAGRHRACPTIAIEGKAGEVIAILMGIATFTPSYASLAALSITYSQGVKANVIFFQKAWQEKHVNFDARSNCPYHQERTPPHAAHSPSSKPATASIQRPSHRTISDATGAFGNSTSARSRNATTSWTSPGSKTLPRKTPTSCVDPVSAGRRRHCGAGGSGG